jgi:LemA protein
MKKVGCLVVLGVVVVVALIICGGLVSVYNSLVTQSQAVDAQWGQVETQYQRRYDLIPNLVNSVRGLMIQEKTVFDNIAQARTKYGVLLRSMRKLLQRVKLKPLWGDCWL